jgi:hypothetical protein
MLSVAVRCSTRWAKTRDSDQFQSSHTFKGGSMKAARSRMSYAMPLIGVFLLPLLTPCSMFGQALPGARFVAYSASGSDATAIALVVDAFRNVLGTNNADALGSQPNGRREINWDGGGDAANATMFPTPMITFNTGLTTRGVVFTTETGFEISGQPTPEFGEIDITYPGIFTTFSAPRLFTPHGSTITDVHFFVPGTATPGRCQRFRSRVHRCGSTTEHLH